MIDFACKRFSLPEIIKCSLGLTRAEYKVLETLLSEDGKWFTSEVLSKRLSLDLSTVQRCMKKLHGKELISRNQENLSSGGYIFYYRIRQRDELRARIMSVIRSWVAGVEKELGKW